MTWPKSAFYRTDWAYHTVWLSFRLAGAIQEHARPWVITWAAQKGQCNSVNRLCAVDRSLVAIRVITMMTIMVPQEVLVLEQNILDGEFVSCRRSWCVRTPGAHKAVATFYWIGFMSEMNKDDWKTYTCVGSSKKNYSQTGDVSTSQNCNNKQRSRWRRGFGKSRKYWAGFFFAIPRQILELSLIQ